MTTCILCYLLLCAVVTPFCCAFFGVATRGDE